jgi:hydrogenase expression/formation protein HypE
MIKAVVFDFDGTLTKPGSIDLKGFRGRLGCPPGSAIFEFIQGLEPAERREKALRELEDVELAGARLSAPNEGAEELVRALAAREFPLGIYSNNSRSSIETALRNFVAVSLSDFDVVLSREDSGRPKPHPDGVRIAAIALGVKPAELLFVGDFAFDIQAGHRAGAATAFLTNGGFLPELGARPDFIVEKLADLKEILGL